MTGCVENTKSFTKKHPQIDKNVGFEIIFTLNEYIFISPSKNVWN